MSVTMIEPDFISDDGRMTLYCADCLQVLPQLEAGSVDAVITDPPYDEKTHIGARYGFRKTSSEIDFDPLDDFSFLEECLRISRSWVIAFCAMEMYGDYKRATPDNWVRAGFWRKPNGVPQFTGDRPGQPGEGIAILHSTKKNMSWNGGGKHGFWEYCIQQGERFHQTQKPLSIMLSLVCDFTNEEYTVLDPFMGSGTTGVAAVKLGRRFIGIEISRDYYNIAEKRIRQALAQPALFQI